MQKRRIFILILGTLSFSSSAQKNLRFSSLDSVLTYAEEHSATIRTGDKQSLLAKSTKLAALANTVNLRCPLTATFTDNTELPVNYVPGEFFGGPAGSTRELSLGQEYVSNYAITPQIDFINPANWARVKSASINIQLTETQNMLNKKALYENISTVYYNILSLREQLLALKESARAADSILNISQRKLSAGIIREQERNNALINTLSIMDKSSQLSSLLDQQYYTLKLLCDLPSETLIEITGNNPENNISATATPNKLLQKQEELQTALLKSELRANRMLNFSPTVSFIFNQGWQESSNQQFFDPDANRFSTQYYGLKISVPFPCEASRISQNYTAKINYRIAQINGEHLALQGQINDKQLDLNYQAAAASWSTSKQISELKSMNYSKSMSQYQEGILNTETLLTSFTDKVNAELNEIIARAAFNNAASKIRINNTIQ